MTGKAIVLFERNSLAEGLLTRLRDLNGGLDISWPVSADPGLLAAEHGQSARLVLLDGDRSDIDPMAVIAALAQRLPGVPVVVFGAPGESSRESVALAAGATAFIPRDYTSAAIVAALRLVLANAEDAASRQPRVADAGAGSVPALRDLGLTDAESAVLALAAQGKTNHEIALALGKREGTVRIQMSAILRKLEVRNRSEAIIVAMRVIKVVRSQIEQAEHRELDIGWLLPHMEFRRHPAGHELFRKGDRGDELYLIQRGRVRLPEIEVDLGEHDMFGEIGIFSPDHLRTCSAVCVGEVDLFALSEDKVKQAYFLNPGFALFILQAVTRRLMADRQRS